ncbi:hypothetical protein BJV78DRAFT_433618 [Lactifluus subvellereus]|nr:hypothetical protein BJV78DRAFT_433618 [Lactifluus subvellereus]
MPLPVAINGTISLQAPQPLTKRAMIIRMSEETLDALAAYSAHPPLQFEFGNASGIHIGSTFFPMRGDQESTPHELYLRSALASKINAPLKLYADIAGKFTVGRELNGKAESKVHQSTADAQKSKSGGRIRLLEAPPALNPPSNKAKSSAPPKKRKPAVSAPIAATVKRVPVRVKNEGSSAARGQSPPPAPPTSQSTSPVPPAMRALMIHLLAKGSRTKEDVLTQVGGPDASESLRLQLNELLVTIAERERPNSKTAVPGQAPLYTLLPVSWKEVRPYEFTGLSLTDEERRTMWIEARRGLHSLGIPQSDPAWDYVRTRPGSAVTATSKVGAGSKRAPGAVGTVRKKNAGSTSKAPVEAKDEGIRPPSQTARPREGAGSAPQSTKVTPKREEDDVAPAPRRFSAASGRNAAWEAALSPSQAQGLSKKTGLTDARAKRDESSKTNGRPGVAPPIQSSSSRERDQEREKPTHVAKKQREDESDLDREKGQPTPAPRPKKRKEDASDLESLRDCDVTDATGKVNAKRKKPREDYGDKDKVNGTGNANKRRKTTDDDAPYKPGGGGTGASKPRERERDRDRESDRGHDKTRDRDPLPMAKRRRESDRASLEPSPLPRKSAVRERDGRQRERERDRSVSPPRRVKRELSPLPHSSHQRENSPLPRAGSKRTGSPARDPVKREASPRPRGHSRRDDSTPPPRSSKRAASPPRPQPRVRDRDRDRDRDRESSVTTRRRRNSPIYTSSEEEHHDAPVRRNAPSSVTSSSSSREAVRTPAYTSHPLPPSAPYPKDREALQARYRKGYRNYIAVYHQLLDERAKIQDALDDLGREGSAHGDGDTEMMGEEGLRDLADRYAAWTRELEGIRNAYSAVAERMDITA